MPELYFCKWEGQRNETLVIDFPSSDRVTNLSSSYFEERYLIFKKKLIERTNTHHDAYLASIKDINDPLKSIDPFQSQMWHHGFDPHTVPAIPLGDLK